MNPAWYSVAKCCSFSRTQVRREILLNFHMLINFCILEVSLNQTTFLVNMFHINIMPNKKTYSQLRKI